MVCDRCISTVSSIITSNGLHISSVRLGEVDVSEEDHQIPKDRLEWQLRDAGFELIYDKKEQLVALTKAALIEILFKSEHEEQHLKLSVLLADKLGMGYQQISKTFSEVQGETIEKFYKKLRIERVKELIRYGDLNVSDISWKLGYSSVQHLSTQFKSVTGITISEFKESESIKRQNLDSL